MSASLALEATLVPATLCACATILVYDWICTLGQEISYVWIEPQWTMGTLFFVLNRYLPFIDVFISLSAKMTRISPETCLTRYKIVGWLTVLGIFLSEGILMLRTYALWERKRGVRISLAAIYVGTFIPTVVFTQLELASLEYMHTDEVGCRLARVGSVGIFAYLMLMISETTIVVMTAVKAYRDLRHSRHSRQWWISQLYRDGMLFYVYLLAISIANILVPILAPPMFSNWLATPQRVLHSVLCTRVLLLIRGLSMRSGFQESFNLSVYETRLAFASAGDGDGLATDTNESRRWDSTFEHEL